jgi:hypothetical protein
VNRIGPTALAGLGAALLCNYWVLEDALAKRTNLDDAWISDLAARTQAFGWRFAALQIVSGLAIAGFAALLLGPLGVRSPMLRRGILALLAAGALVAITGAAPLSCAEGLEARCELAYDPLDLIHSTATFGEIVATTLAFAWIGLGLLRLPPVCTLSPTGRQSAYGTMGAGRVTLAIGVAWLGLAVLSGVGYLVADLDSVKGLLQRIDQVIFGAWLVLLGLWAHESAPTRE